MINQAISNRRSIRSFSQEPVSDDSIKEIIKAAQFAPSAMNNRSWEFLVLKSPTDKEKLFELVGTRIKQEAVKNAPVVIIPLMDTEKAVLPIQDLSIASENIFLQATELGLGSFWKNIMPEEAVAVKKAFDIPEKFLLLNVIPLGYPAAEIKAHTEEEFNESKIHWSKW